MSDESRSCVTGWPLPFTSLPRLVHPVGQRRLVKERVANERKEVAARIVRFLSPVSFSLTTFPSHYIRAAGGSEGGDRALRDHGTRPKAERRRER